MFRTQDQLQTKFEARLQRFAEEYLLDLSPSGAARRAGWKNGAVGMQLLRRPDTQRIVAELMAERRHRLCVDADTVLQALLMQLERLTAMLGQDLAELYSENGQLLPVKQWPAIWRERLITGIDTSQAGTSDDVTETVKVKRESTLAIEKQITEVLCKIGDHTQVKAFPTPGDKLAPREAIEITVVHVGDRTGVKIEA